MKRTALALLGLALALMAITVAVHLDLVTIWFTIPCAFGAWKCFRAAFRPMAARSPQV